MSIVEVVIVLLIVTVGIVGAYQIVSSGTKLADTTESRIQAIAYAREGLEGMENVRDTNWIKFSSDYAGCFDVFGYNVTCVGSNSSPTVPRITPGSYIITQTGGLWELTRSIAPTTATIAWAGRADYVKEYALYTNADGLTSQLSGLTGLDLCTGTRTRNCKTPFTRELRVTRPDANTIVTESIVSWVDPSRTKPFEVRLSATLKNWKMAYFSKTAVVTSNSCAADPSFPNIGALTRNPLSVGMNWTYSATGGNCTYTCQPGFSGAGCTTTFTSPTCSDGLQNGTETWVDCGGSCAVCASIPSPICSYVWSIPSPSSSGNPTINPLYQTSGICANEYTVIPPTGPGQVVPCWGYSYYNGLGYENYPSPQKISTYVCN